MSIVSLVIAPHIHVNNHTPLLGANLSKVENSMEHNHDHDTFDPNHDHQH